MRHHINHINHSNEYVKSIGYMIILKRFEHLCNSSSVHNLSDSESTVVDTNCLQEEAEEEVEEEEEEDEEEEEEEEDEDEDEEDEEEEEELDEEEDEVEESNCAMSALRL